MGEGGAKPTTKYKIFMPILSQHVTLQKRWRAKTQRYENNFTGILINNTCTGKSKNQVHVLHIHISMCLHVHIQ